MAHFRPSCKWLSVVLTCLVLTGFGAAPLVSRSLLAESAASTGDYAVPSGACGTPIAGTCASPNPPLATSRFVDAIHGQNLADRPVLLAFHDTVDDDPSAHTTLGTYGEFGSVYGLAYNPCCGDLYAAPYLKRGSLFSPGGPGHIKRIDLSTGFVEGFAFLPAGSARLHNLPEDDDAQVVDWIGRAGFGDIDADCRHLYAVNLYDGRIYRISIPGGRIEGSFPHGAADLPWGKEARPFGLGLHNGELFHGVVEPIGWSPEIAVPVGHIYLSLPDGTELREVASFALDPSEADAPMEPWLGDDRPVISDIVARPDGSLAVAVRNLAMDATVDEPPPRLGDLLPASRDGDRWDVILTPERFDDSLFGRDEVFTGGLAHIPGMPFLVSAGGPDAIPEDAASAVWFDETTGAQKRIESLRFEADDTAEWLFPATGDVEVLCAADSSLDPRRVATATSRAVPIATATCAAAATSVARWATAHLATMTAVQPTVSAYAPTQEALQTSAARQTVAPARATEAAAEYLRIRASCDTDDPCFAVAHQQSVTDNERRTAEDAVTAFSSAGPLAVLADGRAVGSVHGLAFDAHRGHLYAGAFDPPYAGPHGVGAIYRIELGTGRVVSWAALQVASVSHEGLEPGEAGLGDIDLDDAATQLFAVNLYDRNIYRLSVPEGALLGVFGHGARGESWGRYGLPFGLGYYDGWLYHAVAPDLESLIGMREAVVYRSRPDGTDMSEVGRLALNYRVPGQATGHGWSFPVDIMFGANGQAVLGLRDGLTGLTGDLIPASVDDTGWALLVEPEHFDDKVLVDESSTGSGAVTPADRLVAAASSLQSRLDAGAIWFDNATGAIVGHRQLEPGGAQRDCDAEGSCSVLKSYESLGDVELLCPGTMVTPGPGPSATLAPTPSHTPTSTSKKTPTSGLTPTVAPTAPLSCLYLPLAHSELGYPE